MVTMVNTSTIKVQGWELSENKNSTVKIYIDNRQMSTTITKARKTRCIKCSKRIWGSCKKCYTRIF